jgi:hypothetical protein
VNSDRFLGKDEMKKREGNAVDINLKQIEQDTKAAMMHLEEACGFLEQAAYELPDEWATKINRWADTLEGQRYIIGDILKDIKAIDWDGSQEAYERMKDELWENR